jgi:hypothetical protein
LAFKAGRALGVKAGWALVFKAGAAPARRLKSGLKKCIPHCRLTGRRRQIESLYALIQSLNEAVRVKGTVIRPAARQPRLNLSIQNFS